MKYTKIADGVRIREYKSGKRAIVISFTFQGDLCRETLKDIDPDKKKSHSYAINLRGAIKDKISRGTFDYAEYFPDSPRAWKFGHAQAALTVEQAQKGLIADLELAGREKSTLDTYEKSAKRINAHIGKVRVSSLTPEHFREMFRKRKVSRKTWNNDLLPLRRALRRCVMDGAIATSPLDRIDIDELVPKSKKPQPDPFNLAEIEAILKAAKGHCQRAHNLIEFAFYTGLRIEELVALTWADVDLKAETASINKAALISIGSSDTKPTKTQAGNRIIDLRSCAIAALKRQRTITGFRGEHVFTRWNTLKPFNRYNQLNRRWRTILRYAEVRYRPISQTRHTWFSHMLSSGELEIYVTAQGGHEGTGQLVKYSRWRAEWKDESERKYGT